jgi:predicted RND superfamily exporter protein
LVILFIIVLLYLSFRTLAGVVIPLLSVVISTIWTLGLMCLLRIPLTIVTDVIPVVLIAVGSAYSIHLINKFYAHKTSLSAEKKVQLVLSDLTLPVFLAALTTMVGFLSFVFGSYLTMIQQFGFFSAIGVLFALLIAITFVPALLSFIKSSPAPAPTRSRFKTFSNNLNAGSRFIRPERSRLMIGITLVILVFSLLGIPRIQRKVDILDYFPANRSIRVTEEEIMNPKFGGSIPLQILVHGDLFAPEVLTEIEKVQNYLQTLELVHNPFSIVDLFLELNAALGDGWQIPDSREKVANLWFFLEGEEIIMQLINDAQTEAIIQANLVYAPMNELTALVTEINTFLNSLDPTVCRFEQAGMHVIYRNLDQSLLNSQIQSLFLSLVLILIIITLLLRSLKEGLTGLIPIVFTLIVIFGFMGYARIPLDIATVLVASISMGIGIDYSIHFLVRFRIEKKRMDIKSAVQEALKITGKGIFVNMITVAGGFSLFICAELVPLQRFGILVTLTMLSSGFATLYLLPSLLSLGADKTRLTTDASSLVVRDG